MGWNTIIINPPGVHAKASDFLRTANDVSSENQTHYHPPRTRDSTKNNCNYSKHIFPAQSSSAYFPVNPSCSSRDPSKDCTSSSHASPPSPPNPSSKKSNELSSQNNQDYFGSDWFQWITLLHQGGKRDGPVGNRLKVHGRLVIASRYYGQLRSFSMAIALAGKANDWKLVHNFDLPVSCSFQKKPHFGCLGSFGYYFGRLEGLGSDRSCLHPQNHTWPPGIIVYYTFFLTLCLQLSFSYSNTFS